ncbi:MAG: hypothetical protein NUV86_12635 [Candidatus Scalindua sp.]|nr:hypothetical protein [Candidatus Scalindua sp.]MCR4343850.1 hypothetical protein [Candidatus Scalindua sp.]
MKILGKYKVSTDFIRSLTINCHALDLSAHHLLVGGIHSDSSLRTKEIYEEKISTSLLSLAVAVRTLLYQGVELLVECPNINCIGFYKSERNNDKARVSIKDVCDKIIHADSIDREFEEIENADPRPMTFIKGSYHKKPWQLDISVSMFCEYVLNWVDKIEKA